MIGRLIGFATTPEKRTATVCRYEPETAAQWALTLPPGKARATKAAAEAFKVEHGIK